MTPDSTELAEEEQEEDRYKKGEVETVRLPEVETDPTDCDQGLWRAPQHQVLPLLLLLLLLLLLRLLLILGFVESYENLDSMDDLTYFAGVVVVVVVVVDVVVDVAVAVADVVVVVAVVVDAFAALIERADRKSVNAPAPAARDCPEETKASLIGLRVPDWAFFAS